MPHGDRVTKPLLKVQILDTFFSGVASAAKAIRTKKLPTMTTPAPAPAAAAQPAPATAPAATATTPAATTPAVAVPVAAPATTENKPDSGAVFPAGTAQLPPPKKRKIQARCDNDAALKHMLDAVVGTSEKKFQDGMLYTPTIDQIVALWNRLDFVHEGVLKQTHFQSVRGVDPIWNDFLEFCDVDGDGTIREAEFVAGFVFQALEKRVSMNVPAGATVTGWQVIKSIMDLVNEHVLQEVADVKKTMGWN